MRTINIFIWGITLLVLGWALFGMSFSIFFQFATFGLLSVVLGISHGSVDHLVSKFIIQKDKEVGKVRFIMLYVILAAGYAAFWLIAPLPSFVILLLFSAYHFGQAELQEYLPANSTINRSITYMLWGITIILGLLYGNWHDTLQLLADSTILPQYTTAQVNAYQNTLGQSIFISCVFTVVQLLRHYQADQLPQRWFAQSFASLVLLMLLFVHVPFLVSFSIFFGLWHALKVLHHEYNGLKQCGALNNVKQFIMALMPLSLISYLGLALFSAIYFGLVWQGPLHIYIIIFIASLALPHSLVMDRMYHSFYKRGASKKVE